MALISEMLARLGLDTTEFTGGLNSAMGKLDDFGGKAMAAGGVLTGALTVPLTAIGLAAFKAGTDFDEASDKIRAGTGATGEALKGLEASFKTVFEGVPASSDAVATAITTLNQRLDLTGPALDAMATQMLNLARITGTEVRPLIESTTQLFKNWKIDTDDQAGALDFLFKATQATGTGIGTLATSVTDAGVVLKQFGFSFEESTALLAKFEQEGIDSGAVMQSLNRALASMGKEGVTDAGSALEILVERIQNAGTEAEARSIAFDTFGNRAGAKMAESIRSGRFEIDELVTSLKSSGETINTAAADTLSFGEKWDLFKNKLEVALVPLGVGLVNALTNLLQYSQPLIDMLGGAADWFSKLDPTIQTVGVAFGALVAAAGPLLLAIGGIASGVSAVSGVIGGGAGLTAILSALGPIIAGIAAAWAAWELGSWLATLEPVRAAFSSLWEGLQSLWGSVVQLGTALTPLWEVLKSVAAIIGETFAAAGSLLGVLVAGGLIIAVQTLGAAFTGASVIMKGVVFVVDSLVNALKEVWSWILKIPGVKEIVDKAGEAFDSLKGKVSDLTKGTGKAEDAAKAHEKQIKSLAVGTGSAVGKSIKSFDDLTESVKLLTVKHDAQKDALFKLSIETIKAREATDDWNRGLITIKGTTIDYIAEAENMVDRIGDIERATKSLKDMAVPAFGRDLSGAITAAAGKIEDMDAAYKTLGVTSTTESAIIVSKANAARDAILGDPNADEFAKKTAVYKALKIQVEQATLMGQDVPQKTRDALAAMEQELTGPNGLESKFEGPWKDSIQQVSTNVTNAAQDIVGILIGTEEGTVADALKKLGQSVLTSFTEPALAAFNKFITEGIEKAIGWLIGKAGLTEALDSVGKKLGDVFGGGSSVPSGGGGGGVPTGGGGAPTPAPDDTGGGGGAPGGGGGGMQDPLAWVNAVANVVSAIWNVRQEGTLNAIEQHTKVMAITMAGIAAPWEAVPEGQTTMSGQLWMVIEELRFGVFAKALERIRDEMISLGASYINPNLNSIKESLWKISSMDFRIAPPSAAPTDVTGPSLEAIRTSVATVAGWDMAGALMSFQIWLDAKLTAVAQWISPTAGALAGGIAAQVADNAAPVVQLPAPQRQSQPLGGYLSDLFKPSRQQSKEVNDGLSVISDGLQSFQSLYSQRSEALFGIVSGIRDSIMGLGTEIAGMKEMLWRVMTESYDVLRDVTNMHLAMIQESVAVLPKMAAANASGGGNFEINIFMDGQKIYEVVVDRLGRDLNQSGQILR